MPQSKLQQLKEQAFQLAKSLRLHCHQTKHFKKRFIGLDFRTKSGWLHLIERLKELASGIVVHLLALRISSYFMPGNPSTVLLTA